MKRLFVTLSIVVLLAVLLPGFPIIAQSTHIPHENPATAKNTLDLAALIVSYSDIYNLAALRQYQDTQSILQEMKHANIPHELKYIMDRYNTLSQELLTSLNKAESLLGEASILFSRNQISDAKQRLDSAEATIHDTQLLLKDIESATDSLCEKLGVFAASATTHIKLAYDSLEGSLYQLRELINELEQLRERLSLDPKTEIKTSFYYSTALEVAAPETAHPGLPIPISGQVNSTDGNVERTIKVFLDNTQLAEETAMGQFSLEITPSPQTLTGKHSLTVTATPQEHHSGASKSLSINITKIPIQTVIRVPRVILMPKPIQISGMVSHDLTPIQDARVSLAFRQSSNTVKTGTDGSFTATVEPPKLPIATATSSNPFYATTTTVELPLDLSLIGPQELTITIQPVEPWYDPIEIKRKAFAVSPANMGLMLFIFLSLGLLAYKGVRTRAPTPQRERAILQPQAQELPTVTPLPRPGYEPTSIKGRILSTYTSSLEAIEKITGISMSPHTTLREFLQTAIPRLATAVKPLTELTAIAEVALYSSHRLNEDIATRAEQLAATIKEELYNGTP